MHVLGHEHVSPDMKAMPVTGPFEGLHRPGARPVPGKKRLPLETRERECVGVTGIIVSPASLAKSRRILWSNPVHMPSLQRLSRIGKHDAAVRSRHAGCHALTLVLKRVSMGRFDGCR